MPTRTPRMCNKCRRTVPADSRCVCMPKPAWSGKNGYTGSGSTRQWRKLRASKLRANPMCETPGCKRLAAEVDHKQNVGSGGARYDYANLQSLCKPHHREKTAREAAMAQLPDECPY